MNTLHIDHKELLNEIEQMLDGISYDQKEHSDGKTIRLYMKHPDSLLEIEITKDWVGYDFMIDKSVYGKIIGYRQDTDIYPLNSAPEITMEIFEELKQFLDNLLHKKILTGRYNGLPVLAEPINDKGYFVKIYHFRKGWRLFTKIDQQIISNDDLAAYSLKSVE